MSGLTKKQFKTLEWIRRFIKKNGWSPSYREIGDGMGVSNVAAYNAVNRLIDRGHLDKEEGQHRGIKIIEGTKK